MFLDSVNIARLMFCTCIKIGEQERIHEGSEKKKILVSKGSEFGYLFFSIVITQYTDFSFARGCRQSGAKPSILCVPLFLC